MRILLLLAALSLSTLSYAADYKAILLDPTYDHDRFNTQPKDIVRNFRAYTVSFDGWDDDDGDLDSDLWRVPEWVAYEVRAVPALGSSPSSPSPWITDRLFYSRNMAPHDDSYRGIGDVYNRGHMCRKFAAWRLGEEACYNTHTFLNACPQRKELNQGIWLHLEKRTSGNPGNNPFQLGWANEYGSVWVVCGPIFNHGKPTAGIGDPGELKVAVPHAFFKLVIKQSSDPLRPDVLAFLFEHDDPSIMDLFNNRSTHSIEDDDLIPYLVSVDEIEQRSGLDFLTALPDWTEEEIEARTATQLWPSP